MPPNRIKGSLKLKATDLNCEVKIRDIHNKTACENLNKTPNRMRRLL